MGTNRMSEKPRDGVANRWGPIARYQQPLHMSDESQFTSSGSPYEMDSLVPKRAHQPIWSAAMARKL